MENTYENIGILRDNLEIFEEECGSCSSLRRFLAGVEIEEFFISNKRLVDLSTPFEISIVTECYSVKNRFIELMVEAGLYLWSFKEIHPAYDVRFLVLPNTKYLRIMQTQFLIKEAQWANSTNK